MPKCRCRDPVQIARRFDYRVTISFPFKFDHSYLRSPICNTHGVTATQINSGAAARASTTIDSTTNGALRDSLTPNSPILRLALREARIATFVANSTGPTR